MTETIWAGYYVYRLNFQLEVVPCTMTTESSYLIEFNHTCTKRLCKRRSPRPLPRVVATASSARQLECSAPCRVLYQSRGLVSSIPVLSSTSTTPTASLRSTYKP